MIARIATPRPGARNPVGHGKIGVNARAASLAYFAVSCRIAPIQSSTW
jgi:hypothetical protein